MLLAFLHKITQETEEHIHTYLTQSNREKKVNRHILFTHNCIPAQIRNTCIYKRMTYTNKNTTQNKRLKIASELYDRPISLRVIRLEPPRAPGENLLGLISCANNTHNTE